MGNLWYQELNKSALTPPAIVFQVAWGILYILIFTSLILFLKKGITKNDSPALILFSINMLLNFSWSYIFFVIHNTTLALIATGLMIITLIPVIILFGQKSKTAAAFLTVYLLWLFFAFYLNSIIILKN